MAATPGPIGKTHFPTICYSSQIAFRNNPGQYLGSAMSEHRIDPEPIESKIKTPKRIGFSGFSFFGEREFY
jgi:hypothetical protein